MIKDIGTMHAIYELAISRILDDAEDVRNAEVDDFTDGKRIAYIGIKCYPICIRAL